MNNEQGLTQCRCGGRLGLKAGAVQRPTLRLTQLSITWIAGLGLINVGGSMPHGMNWKQSPHPKGRLTGKLSCAPAQRGLSFFGTYPSRLCFAPIPKSTPPPLGIPFRRAHIHGGSKARHAPAGFVSLKASSFGQLAFSGQFPYAWRRVGMAYAG